MSAADRETLKNWLGLWRAPGFGPAIFFKLLNHFPELQGLFPANSQTLKTLGYPDKIYAALKQIDWRGVVQDLAWAERDQCTIILCNDVRYPYLLRQIPDAPPLLFVQGDDHCLNHLQLAVVGSRNASMMGFEMARQFSAYLAQSNIIITSGLAIGIDSASHQGALSIPTGKTIAVMGTGPDSIYPARHQTLAKQIIARGALVTEFPTGVKIRPEHFPRRNRIISGLSVGVLIVEAALQSGSLITARLALEQGREVFAIPGSIHHPLAKGCHALIKQGAKLVETGADIIVEITSLSQAVTEQLSTYLAPSSDNLSPELSALFAYIDCAPTPVDVIVARCGLAVEQVSSLLLLLELANKITAVPGGYMRI